MKKIESKSFWCSNTNHYPSKKFRADLNADIFGIILQLLTKDFDLGNQEKSNFKLKGTTIFFFSAVLISAAVAQSNSKFFNTALTLTQ